MSSALTAHDMTNVSQGVQKYAQTSNPQIISQITQNSANLKKQKKTQNTDLYKLFHSVLRGPSSGIKHFLCTTTNLRFQHLIESPGVMIKGFESILEKVKRPPDFLPK